MLVDAHSNARLSDFGLVSLLQTTSTATDASSFGGTARWMAPEVLNGGRPTLASDMYSAAIVLWEVRSNMTLSYIPHTYDAFRSSSLVASHMMTLRQE